MLPFVVTVISLIFSPARVIVKMLFFYIIEFFFTSAISLPFAFIFYKNIFNHPVMEYKNHANESIIFHTDYLEHSYDYEDERQIFTIKYDTILNTEQEKDFNRLKINSPFFIKEVEKEPYGTGNRISNIEYIQCTHEIPLYFKNANSLVKDINNYSKEFCKRTRSRILIDKGVFTEEDVLKEEQKYNIKLL